MIWNLEENERTCWSRNLTKKEGWMKSENQWERKAEAEYISTVLYRNLVSVVEFIKKTGSVFWKNEESLRESEAANSERGGLDGYNSIQVRPTTNQASSFSVFNSIKFSGFLCIIHLHIPRLEFSHSPLNFGNESSTPTQVSWFIT